MMVGFSCSGWACLMSLNFISHWGEQRENWKLLSLVRSPAMFSTKSTYRNYVNPHWTCWLEHWLNKDPMDQRFSHNPYSWSAWYTPEKLTTGTWKSPICKGKVMNQTFMKLSSMLSFVGVGASFQWHRITDLHSPVVHQWCSPTRRTAEARHAADAPYCCWRM